MIHYTEFEKDTVILKNLHEFDPDTILFCGQAFRWRKEGNTYRGIAYKRIIELEILENGVRLFPVSKNEYKEIWEGYFDLKRDYQALKKEFSKDAILKKGIEYAPGMRVLNQQPFETMISFIISANNNIKRICGIIEKLCTAYGEAIEFGEKTYYVFPEADALANASEKDLQACGAGYRARYIREAAKAVCEGFDLEALKEKPYRDAKKELTGIMGIGPKVANCILLYSLGFSEAFPLDVWIKRTIYNLYGFSGKSDKETADFIASRFGKHAGIAQQYLFHYVRKNRLGIQTPQCF